MKIFSEWLRGEFYSKASHCDWPTVRLVSLQGVHQPGDPGGHRDQTQPSLPDQRRGPNPATGLRCHGDRLRRGGASGLQLQKGRGFVWLCVGTVTGRVDQGGAPRRHPGSAGEHPQRPGDVGHSIRRHRRADVRRLWLPAPEKLSPGGRPAAPAPLLPSPEPPRRPSLSRRQQRHPLRLREALLSGLHKKKKKTNQSHNSSIWALLYFIAFYFWFRHFSFCCFCDPTDTVLNTDSVGLLWSVCLIYLPVNLLTE